MKTRILTTFALSLALTLTAHAQVKDIIDCLPRFVGMCGMP